MKFTISELCDYVSEKSESVLSGVVTQRDTSCLPTREKIQISPERRLQPTFQNRSMLFGMLESTAVVKNGCWRGKLKHGCWAWSFISLNCLTYRGTNNTNRIFVFILIYTFRKFRFPQKYKAEIFEIIANESDRGETTQLRLKLLWHLKI